MARIVILMKDSRFETQSIRQQTKDSTLYASASYLQGMASLLNSRGQTLIQVMIAAGIGIILLMAFASTQLNQARENRALTEKLAALDFQQALTRSFADGTLCTFLLGTPNNIIFDSTNATPNSKNQPQFSVPRSSIPINSTPNAPALASAGLAVSPLAPSVVAAAGQPFQVVNIVGTSNGATGSYSANFVVNFNEANLIRGLRPASTLISLQTTSSGATQTVTACSSNASAASSFGGWYATDSKGLGTCQQVNPQTGTCGCPSGFQPYLTGFSQSPAWDYNFCLK